MIMNIGKNIRTYRNEKKLSQRKLAELSGVSFAYIQQLERGQRDNPSTRILNKIAAVFNIKLTQLL